MGCGLTIELKFKCERILFQPSFGVTFRNPLGEYLLRLTTRETYGEMPSVTSGGIVRLHVDHLDFLPGTYFLNIGLSNGNEQVDFIENALKLDITPRPIYPTGKLPPRNRGIIFARCSWNYDYI